MSMPHVATSLVHPPGLGNWFKDTVGLLVPPLGAYWWGQTGAEQLQGAINPGKITEPPPVTVPAAPQTQGAMTIPGAWTPDEMYAQTNRQMQIALDSYAAGSRTGFQAGQSDSQRSQGDVGLIVLAAVVGVVGLLIITKR
jgi:hypothetical protein